MFTDLAIDTRVTLNNGVRMPVFGLGTYQSRNGSQTRDVVLYALEIGYRLIDTATIYGNEEDVGRAVRDSNIPRDEIFVTTKLWNSDHGFSATISACNESLKLLGLSYVDLYLIHWPVEGIRRESWRALEALEKQGKCRSIGVSNYMIRHLEELLEDTSTVPAVNQVEFSPYLYQKDLLSFCRSHAIQVEAYSPLTKGQKLNDAQLVGLARRYGKSPAQILIRWPLQRGTVVIPKSSRKERIEENAGVFDFSISDEDMETIDSFNENYRTSWDPSTVR
ncbi:MAG: aldo/keto reductase [Fidelibacterota bacterium]